MAEYLTGDMLITLLTLTALEIVLGIDNIIVIAIIAGKLPGKLRNRARVVGLTLAIFTRVLLLLTLSWMMKLTQPVFTLLERPISGKDLILIGGGAFLIYKAFKDIAAKVGWITEGEGESKVREGNSFTLAVFQILILDIVFSLDSVITAVGLAQQLPIMIAAIVISILVMLVFSVYVVEFIEKYPTIKMLALAFLALIGGYLMLEGVGYHVEKAILYVALGFSLAVELLNLQAKRVKRKA